MSRCRHTLGSLELKIICDATNVKLTPETLRSNISDCALPEATKERLRGVVPEEFGIVGAKRSVLMLLMMGKQRC